MYIFIYLSEEHRNLFLYDWSSYLWTRDAAKVKSINLDVNYKTKIKEYKKY